MGDPIQRAIDDFNAQGKTESTPLGISPVRARRPILATDCDYEIVRFTGVQGVKLRGTEHRLQSPTTRNKTHDR